MIGESTSQEQQNLFKPLLREFINLNHELSLLADKIDWKYFEDEFSGLYSTTGKPAMPIRLMVGSLMLKRIYNLGDETICEAWVRVQYSRSVGQFKGIIPIKFYN